MNITRRAVIDVGTNSVKILVADVAGRTVHPLLEQAEQTRLGQGLAATQFLQTEAIAQTARTVARFAALAVQWRTEHVRVVATSAARDARNQAALRAAIRQAANLPVEILTGEQEAEWAFRGVNSDPHFAGRRLVVLDVGGGSTQLIAGDNPAGCVRYSFTLGALRLLEQLRPGDPPGAGELARCRVWLREYFDRNLPSTQAILPTRPSPQGAQLVGTGGTSSLLATMHLGLETFDRERIEATSLAWAQIRQLMEQLWNMSLAERSRVPGLPPQRADVILTGVAIHAGIMEHFGLTHLQISTRGLRFGALICD